jgi:spore maturation protein B
MISLYILPIFVLFIIIYACKKNINIYDTFLEGAKEGIHLSINIIPAILGMVFAVNIFLDSGILTRIIMFFPHAFVPAEVLAMAFLRPITGTATLAILSDIYAKFGPDSFWGNLGSIIQGCTDTTIYVLALYFGSIRITKTRHALKVGLFADAVGIALAFILSFLLFS